MKSHNNPIKSPLKIPIDDRLHALRQPDTAGRHHRLPALRFQAQGLTTVALRLVETTKAQLNASPELPTCCVTLVVGKRNVYKTINIK